MKFEKPVHRIDNLDAQTIRSAIEEGRSITARCGVAFVPTMTGNSLPNPRCRECFPLPRFAIAA